MKVLDDSYGPLIQLLQSTGAYTVADRVTDDGFVLVVNNQARIPFTFDQLKAIGEDLVRLGNERDTAFIDA